MTLEKYYGLEEHLKMLSENSSTADMLNSIWTLDKRKLSVQLSTTSPLFFTFSDHGPAHSQTIVSAINRVLGERVKELSSTDTWMLLESAYRHDLGMQVPREDIKRFVQSPDFIRFLKELEQGDKKEIRELAFAILHPANIGKQESITQRAERILENEHNLASVLSEYYRKQHGINAKEALADDKITRLLQEIPPRLWNFIGKICQGHTENRDSYILSLPYCEDGVGNDVVHPRFLQILLRLGDLLDLDNNRFNPHQLTLWGDEIPTDSMIHQLKHNAVQHLFINPDKIEVITKFELNEISFAKLSYGFEQRKPGELYPATEAIYKQKAHELALQLKHESATEILNILESNPLLDAKSIFEIEQQEQNYITLAHLQHSACTVSGAWFRWIQDELDYFAREWANIAPPGFPGTAPQFNKQEIWWQNQKLDNDTLRLRYTIGHKRAVQIIQGTGLYGDPSDPDISSNSVVREYDTQLVFIREMVQNAMDATKIQVFRYLKEGRYGDPLTEFGNTPKEWKAVKVLGAIGDFINHLRVEVRIYYNSKANARSRLRLEFVDVGTGIDGRTLKNMSRIGETRNQDLKDEIDQMPEWLRPNGAFGIGMQSVFGLVNEFKGVSGSRKDHKLRDLFFHSAQDGGELFAVERIQQQNESVPYGTRMKIDLQDKDLLKTSIDIRNEQNQFDRNCEILFDVLHEQILSMLGKDIFPIRIRYFVNDVEVIKRRFDIYSVFKELTDALKPMQKQESVGKYCITLPSEAEPTIGIIFNDADHNIILNMTLTDLPDHVNQEALDERYLDSSVARPIRLFYRGLLVSDVYRLNQMPYPCWHIDAFVYNGAPEDYVTISRNFLASNKIEELYPVIAKAADQALGHLWEKLKKLPDETSIQGTLRLLGESKTNALSLSMLYYQFFTYFDRPKSNRKDLMNGKLCEELLASSTTKIETSVYKDGECIALALQMRDIFRKNFTDLWFIHPNDMPITKYPASFIGKVLAETVEHIFVQDIFSEFALFRYIKTSVSGYGLLLRQNTTEHLAGTYVYQFGSDASKLPLVTDDIGLHLIQRTVDIAKAKTYGHIMPVWPGTSYFSDIQISRYISDSQISRWRETIHYESLSVLGSFFILPFTYEQIRNILTHNLLITDAEEHISTAEDEKAKQKNGNPQAKDIKHTAILEDNQLISIIPPLKDGYIPLEKSIGRVDVIIQDLTQSKSFAELVKFVLPQLQESEYDLTWQKTEKRYMSAAKALLILLSIPDYKLWLKDQEIE